MWILASPSVCVHRPRKFRRAVQIFRGNRRGGTSLANSPAKEQKPEWPKQIVDDANHYWIADSGLRTAERNSTSVAPYFLLRTTLHNSVSETFSAGRFSRTKTPLSSSNCASFSFFRSFSVKRSPDFVFS